MSWQRHSQQLTISEEIHIRKTMEMKRLLTAVWKGHGEAVHGHLRHTSLIRSVAMSARGVLESTWFGIAMAVILGVVAIVIGYEIDYVNPQEKWTLIMDWVIFCTFSLEILLRLAAEEFHFIHYFKNEWNVFDVAVTTATAVRFGGSDIISIVRLLRIARIFKLMEVMPNLAVVVNACFYAMVSTSYILMITALWIYLFAVAGFYIFGRNDPVNFGRVGEYVRRERVSWFLSGACM